MCGILDEMWKSSGYPGGSQKSRSTTQEETWIHQRTGGKAMNE